MARRLRQMSEFERFQWLVFFAACIFFLIFYLVKEFTVNCIFEWPIRWDVKTCWNEQVEPAKEKAAEKAANFFP